MKVFVGYGYNDRDRWIEEQVFPILECFGFSIVTGKGMEGNELHNEVKVRIQQSDAAVGFFTLREGQEKAAFNSHIWVNDEMVYAEALGKPIIPIKEDEVITSGLLANKVYITLCQKDRLSCVVHLIEALGRKNILRVKLVPNSDETNLALYRLRTNPSFKIRYRTQDENGIVSQHKDGRLELIRSGFYLNVVDIPSKGFLEIEGVLNGDVKFNSGWESADAIPVNVVL